MTSHPNHLLVGAFIRKQWMQGELPPLLPAVPPSDDAGWDSSIVVHGDWMRGAADRRHSGWNSVENRWSGTQEEAPTQSQMRVAERFG
ncbi:hypothetical protein PG994_008074 [Apiospora phragmitis]|uniref:Uncharacterized protein n=1 Tax=Apiospora phragmitis TaxID=2905665 RepID=A0ABR1US05_9PEZI